MHANRLTAPDRSAALPAPGGARTRGSILVVVIVTILFAAVALTAFYEKASNDLMVDTREALAIRLRREAYSSLEVTLAVLENFRQVNGGLRSPAEGWNDPLGFAGWSPSDGITAEVAFEDESGKLSLPHVDAVTLQNLFQSWELSISDSQRLTDAVMGWMHKDYVPTSTESPDYENGTLPYTAPLRSMRSYSELAAIDVARDLLYDENGGPNDRWHRFVDALSLFDFQQTNLNGGRGDVYTALGSLDPTQQRMLNEYLQGTGGRASMGPGFFQSTNDAAGIIGAGKLPSGYGTTISALRIKITLRQGRTAYHLEAVVAPQGGAKTVQTTATAATATKESKSPNGAAAGTQDSTSTANAQSTTAKTNPPAKLNYPFTLLEIRENTEISSAPPPSSPPQA